MSKVDKQDIAIKAVKYYSDLNIFAAINTILECGCLYTASGKCLAMKIGKLCQAEQQKQLRAYDAAIDRLGKK
jgi:hypothetical protein